jgi:cell division initiation protein
MKNSMVKEAQVLLAQAELEGDGLIRKAQGRVIQIQEEIQELKEERVRFREELRGVIRTYSALLEAGEHQSQEQDGEGLEGNLLLMRQAARK